MRRMPNCEQAIVDIRKVEDYCLSSVHPRGRHKARVFHRALGIDRSQGSWLRSTLLDGVRSREAVELDADAFGSRWQVDVPVMRDGKTAVVRTLWIIRAGESAPRFVTAWVLR